VTKGVDFRRAEEESAALEIASSGSAGSNSLLAAAVLGSAATLIVGVLGVARTKILAVGLEPAGLGLYGQILTLLTALSAASGLGLGLGTTRVVAECRARGDREGLKSALEVSFALPLAIASVLALLIAASSGVLATWLLDDNRALLIVLAALAVPIVALQGPLVHALQGFRDVAGVQGSNVFFGVMLTLASGAGVVVAGLEGAVFALAAGNLAYAVALGWRLRGLVRRAGVKLALLAGLRSERLRQPIVRGMLGIGFASLFVGVASTLAELGVRTLVLKGDGAAAAGIFQALHLISVQLLGVIVASVVFLSFTAITEAHAIGDRERVRSTIDDTLRLTLLLVLPSLVALGLFRDDVIRIFLSAGFAEASDLLPRQLAGDALRTVAWVFGAALVPLGLTRMWVGMTLLSVLGYIVAAAILVPAHGLDGAIAAYVVEWGIATVLTTIVVVRGGFLALSPLTGRTLLAGAVALSGALAAPEPAWPLAAFAVVAFVGLLAAVGTARDERAALAARIRGLLGR
jgi:O-antigen/teichoic acid export membrane protein